MHQNEVGRQRPRFAILFCFMLSSWIAPGAAPEETIADRAADDVSVRDLWLGYQAAKSSDNEAAANQAFERILAAKDAVSSDVFEAPSYLFLEEGGKSLADGDYQAARDEFHHAIKLNPYLWPAYSGLAAIRKQEEGNYKRYFLLDLKGFREAFSLKNTYFLMAALLWFLTNIYWVFIIGFTLTALLLCLKYLKQFYVTTSSHFEHKGARSLTFHLIAFCILMLPLGFGLNFYLVAAFYLVWFFPFFNARERRVTVFLFLLSVGLPFLNHFIANIKQARIDPLLKAQQAQFYEGNSADRIAFLERSPGEGEHAHLSQLILGRIWLAKHEYRRALDYFEGIPTTSKFSGHALVHIGNIQFMSQEYQQAIATYKRSLVRNPGLGESLYNLSVVNAKLGNHREAERYRAELNRKAPDISTRATTLDEEVLEAAPNYVSRFIESLTVVPGSGQKKWYSSPDFYIPAGLGVVLLLFALIHLSFRNVGFLARACEKCGRVFFSSDSPNSEWCSQCVNLYLKKEDLPSEAKSKKFEEVKSYNKLKRRIQRYAQLILPGSKNLLRGDAVSGMVIVFFWVFLLVLCATPITGIPHESMHYMDGPLLITYLWIGVTAIYWTIFGLRPAWQED